MGDECDRHLVAFDSIDCSTQKRSLFKLMTISDSCHAVLKDLDVVVKCDGFSLVSVYDDETQYTYTDAGWTTRIRALVRTYEPDCSCPYCPVCDHEIYEALMFEIEMKRDGLGGVLRGHLEPSVCDALKVYQSKIRPLIASFSRRLDSWEWDQVQLGFGNWEDTPFHAWHVLQHLGSIRWLEGRRDEASRCFTALLDAPTSRQPGRRAEIVRCVDELSRGVPYEERSVVRL